MTKRGRTSDRVIKSLSGQPVCPLALAAIPKQDPRFIRKAFDSGINFFFFYGPANQPFIVQLSPILAKHRADVIIATGSGARTRGALLAARRKLIKALKINIIDVFFAEYISRADDLNQVFGAGGVLDQLCEWKAGGLIRYVGATTHDRALARQLAGDRRVDVLMLRFNMAHRKAVQEVFPTAIRSSTPIVAFTATRWGKLLKHHPLWNSDP